MGWNPYSYLCKQHVKLHEEDGYYMRAVLCEGPEYEKARKTLMNQFIKLIGERFDHNGASLQKALLRNGKDV